MTIDYTSHPSVLAPDGKLPSNVGVATLREAIPPHCFKSSYLRSFGYLIRDILQVLALGAAAYYGIPLIEHSWLRFAAWALYGWAQGLVFVGLWVIGHDCGHSAFFPSEKVNHTVGFILHEFMLTPYFSWRSTHRRHHIYANNMSKDLNYVPPLREEYSNSLGVDIHRLEELTEDAPLVTFFRILMQQLVGWPWYLLTNITAADTSLPAGKKKSKVPFGNSHFAPLGSLFRSEEAHLIFLSDLGLAAMIYCLWTLSSHFGSSTVCLLYLQPYIWINHWIVAITYLHHTHPDVPKYENESWTFLKGALATVDRELGFIGKHILHNIADYHMVHHLFSRIPFYHTEEATRAIEGLLGDAYHTDKERPYLPGVWEAFTKCQWVEPDRPDAAPKDRAMYYKGGPSPPPETAMGIRKWFTGDPISMDIRSWLARPAPKKLQASEWCKEKTG